MSRAAWILAGLFFAGVVVQHILGGDISGFGGHRIPFVICGLVVFVITVAAGLKTTWRRFLSSNSFAVPALISLTILSALGTMILQGEPKQAMERLYGSASSFINALFLNDLFHSVGFVAVLCAGAGGLALTICRKRKPSIRYLGSVGAHLGLLLVLAGAAMGNVWVEKGRLELRKGQSKDHFLVDTPKGAAKVPLGFTVRLDDFHLDMYEPEYSLMVLDINGGHEHVLLKTDPGSPDEKRLTDLGLEIEAFWPDYALRQEITPALNEQSPSVDAPAALQLSIKEQSTERKKYLLASTGSTPAKELLNQGAIAFSWDEQGANELLQAQATPLAPHVLLLDNKSISIEMGKEFILPGGTKVKPLRFLPDFVLDSSTGEPRSRSQEPNNPAVELEVWHDSDGQVSEHETTWLFDRFPNFHHHDQKSILEGVRYKYTSSVNMHPIAAIVLGQDQQIWMVQDGSVRQKLPLKVGSSFTAGGAGVTILAFYPSARIEDLEFSRSKRQVNPLVRIKRIGKPGMADVTLPRPVRLKNGTVIILSPTKGELVRDYVSTLSIWENNGGKLHRVDGKKIEVNYPLEHNGFIFYQADYRPEDPDWSGFQVTRDSGLFLVYIGFSINLLGVLLAVFSPVFIRRKKTSEAGAR